MTAMMSMSDFTIENRLTRSSWIASVFPIFLGAEGFASEEPPSHTWVFFYRAEYATRTLIRISNEQTGDTVVDSYRPRTELGRRLLALRRTYVVGGGQLLDAKELDEERRARRGGVSDV